MKRAGQFIALTALFALLIPAFASTAPDHRLSVSIDPQSRSLAARDSISFDKARDAVLILSSRFGITSLVVDGRRIDARPKSAYGMSRIAVRGARRVEIAWSGKLAALDRSQDHRQTLTANMPVSGPEGTFLPAGSGWYPTVEGELERYRVDIDLPQNQRGLVPGRLLDEQASQERYRARFSFPQPAEGITLLAGPYQVQERLTRTKAGTQVRLRTYFHPDIAGLASGYLDSVAGYLDLYEDWIGPYPFSEFSVVSSPTPTGFGMPTLTYLGVDVLRLPFIRATSLGHEILHNWWGNGVYPDAAKGNWSEGLTNFMADYAYRERESPRAAAEMRLAWLRDYAAMPPEQDAPLARFTSRTHGASQIIGYNKAAMLFFMLRDEIGKEAFDRGVRSFWLKYRFRIAAWDDLRAEFEQASGRQLRDFFAQWLGRSGAPQLRFSGAQASSAKDGWRLSVTLAQGSPAYALAVPLIVRTSAGEESRSVRITRPEETVTVQVPDRPVSVVLDPQLRLFRKLSPDEAPPIVREVMLSEDAAILILSQDEPARAAARALAARLFERTPRETAPDRQPQASAALVVGLGDEVDAWLARMGLAARPAMLGQERSSAQVWTLRSGSGATLLLVSGRDTKSISALERPLPHYGQQSYLLFDGARNIERGVWPVRPQEWRLKDSSSD